MKDLTTLGVSTANSAAANGAAINSALSTYPANTFYLPAGTYSTTGNHTLTTDQKFVGDGADTSVLNVTTAANDGFIFTTGDTGMGISNLTLGGVGSGGSATGSGINTSAGAVDTCLIEKIHITAFYHGLKLGTTNYSVISLSYIDTCVSDGVYQTNNFDGTGHATPSQWHFVTVVSEKNGGRGFLFVATSPHTDTVPLGEYIDCSTFGNSSCGIEFDVSGSAIGGAVRILGGFYGTDGSHEILIDSSVSRSHSISSVFTEQSQAGSGIVVLGSYDATVTGCVCNGHYNAGIYSTATLINISGCTTTDNGIGGASSGAPYGIAIAGGTAAVVSNMSGNTTSATSQDYGIWASGGTVNPSTAANQKLVNLYTGNTTAPTFGV